MKRAMIVAVLASGAARADDAVRITIDDPNVSADAAAWAKLPSLLLEVAGDVAELAVRRTVAEVLAEEADTEWENGIEVVYTKTMLWCGAGTFGVRGVFCYESRAMCAKKAKVCRASKNAGCFGLRARTDNEGGTLCLATYGECEATRRAADLSGEYDVPDACFVLRYRAAKK
jgi:hypothetical protein